jgi:uncharacterized protein YbjT (DUF2867 family)
VARALIVGCGCSGRELGARLRERGWQVRGTSRVPERLPEIEAAGIEPATADPDRPGTVLELVGDVAVVVVLLGSATGGAEAMAAIHGPRLERLLEKLVDTPVRGLAYEATGSVSADVLARGVAAVEQAAATWRLPVAILRSERSVRRWPEETAAKVAALVSG